MPPGVGLQHTLQVGTGVLAAPMRGTKGGERKGENATPGEALAGCTLPISLSLETSLVH